MASASKINGRNVLSIEQRFEIVQHLKSGASVSKLAVGYDVHPATIRRIRQKAVTVCQLAGQGVGMRKRKSLRKPANEELDNRLYLWFLERKENGYSITDSLLLEKAIEMNKEFGGPSTFKASRGWLWNFKNRHSIRLLSMDEREDRNMTAAQQFSESFTRRVEEEGIKYENVYKLDEASFIWKALPMKSQTRDEDARIEGRTMEGDRVTLGLCTNAIGSHKLTPLFICKVENPRALKHCKDCLPVLFKVQPRLLIDQDMFTDWYQNHFKSAVRAHQFETSIYGRVILLLDHFQVYNLRLPDEQDDYFEIIFLPPHSNSSLQPADQRVIGKVKKSYRYKMLRRILSFPGRAKEFCFDYDLKDCIDLLYEAWSEISVTNIRNTMRNVIKEIPKEIPTKEEPDPLELNLQDMISIITGDQPSEEGVNEFLLRCEEMENKFSGSVKQEEKDDDSKNESLEALTEEEEEEIRKAFKTLTKWAKQEPDLIRSHFECLKDYYDQE